MIELTKYIEKLYILKPICVACDISDAAIEQALADLKFDLAKEYTLVIHRNNVGYIPNIGKILKINIVLDDSMNKDMWMLVDDTTKTIIYSPGA